MALTGEAKREWRRKNAAKIRAYHAEWMAKKLAEDPGYVVRTAVKYAENARRKRVAAAAERDASEPMAAATREHFQRRRTDPAYRTACVEAVRAVRRKPRTSPYDNSWTYYVCGRIIDAARQQCRRVSADPWKAKCENLARGLRYIQSKLPSEPRKKRSSRTWGEQIKRLAYSISSKASQHAPAKTPEQAEHRLWMRRARLIAGNMRYRRTLTLSTFKPRPTDILVLRDRQGGQCAYTGEPLTPENAGADHVIAVCDGGTHALSNLALVLQKVNAAKGTMSLPEFVDMCRKVVARFGMEGDPLAALGIGDEVAV